MLMWHGAGTEQSGGSVRVALCALHPRLFAGMTFCDYEDDDTYDMGRGVAADQRMQAAVTRFAATVRADNQANAIATLQKEVS